MWSCPTPGAPTPRPLLLRPLGHTSELEAGSALARGRCSIHDTSPLPFHTRTAYEHFLSPKAVTLTFSRLSLPSPSHLPPSHITMRHCVVVPSGHDLTHQAFSPSCLALGYTERRQDAHNVQRTVPKSCYRPGDNAPHRVLKLIDSQCRLRFDMATSAVWWDVLLLARSWFLCGWSGRACEMEMCRRWLSVSVHMRLHLLRVSRAEAR